MKRLLPLLLLGTLGLASAASNPYVAASITRTYYLEELESCPGKLDMQLGDLWTLTFPDNVSDSYVTRDDLVKRGTSDNRLVMGVVASKGNSPLMVMTEDGRAARFQITISEGSGGRNKDVRIVAGLPPGGTSCAGIKAAQNQQKKLAAPVAATVPPPLTATRPETRPAAPVAVTSPPTNAVVVIPVLPARGAAPPRRTPPSQTPPSVIASTPAPLSVTLKVVGQTLYLDIHNNFGGDVVFSEAALTFGEARASGDTTLTIPSGESLTTSLSLSGTMPRFLGRLNWPGLVVGGQTFTITALVPL